MFRRYLLGVDIVDSQSIMADSAKTNLSDFLATVCPDASEFGG